MNTHASFIWKTLGLGIPYMHPRFSVSVPVPGMQLYTDFFMRNFHREY